MFSASILRLLQSPLIRQSALPSAWSQARCYAAPPSSSSTWGLVDSYPAKKSVSLRTIDELWEAKTSEAKRDLLQYPPANPYSGRTVNVFGGNVADAYQKLQSILQRNKVRYQLRLTERHEKKGAKRRRLSSERWRRQFAHEVRKKVQLVTKIRNRGA